MLIEDKEEQFGGKSIILPEDKHLFVIVGGNNAGKSTFLRSVYKTVGNKESYFVTVNRTVLTGEGSLKEDYKKNIQSFSNQLFQQDNDNYTKAIQPLQDLFNLKDSERDPIIDWYNQYFPNQIIQEREDPENSASPMMLKVSGHSLTKQGSGMRATIEIFIKLFDPSIKVLCIDEPELGLEPVLQKFLFKAIKDKASADKIIIVSTHSHHFLDQEEENNYQCYRDSADNICMKQITDLQDAIFRLLGNTLSSFLLPERILIFEGQSDTTFINRCLDLLNKKSFGVHNSGGNGSVSYAVNAVTQFLKFNKTNLPVYNENTYVVVDDPVKDSLAREWKTIIGDDSRLLVLNKDAIEYYYPERILKEIFETTDTLDIIVDGYLSNKPNGYNSKDIPKTKLAKLVVEKLEDSDLNEDANELYKFLKELP